MDSLVELPQERWPELQNEFKKNWPLGLPGYYLLNTQLAHPNLAESCNFKAYCAYGDVAHGLVAFNVKGGSHEVIILPTSTNTDPLIEAIATSKLIDWNRDFCSPFADNVVLRIFSKVFPRVGIKINEQVATIKHYLPKSSTLYDLQTPPGTFMGPLKYEHIDQVDRAWPHRYASSPLFFKLLIDNELTYGLFSTEDNSLLSWITICEAGFLTHLYCEENHRKKGYAEFVTKYASNDQIKKGNDVFCYIVEANIKSMQLFRKLGYEVVGRGVWTMVTPEKGSIDT